MQNRLVPRVFQVWLFLSAVYGPYSIVFGLSFLAGSELVPGVFTQWVLELADATAIVLVFFFYWHLYKCLVFARDSKDKTVRRPLVWLLLAFVPFASAYVAWVLLPRIVPGWIKKNTGLIISQNQVLIFLILQVVSSGIFRTALNESAELFAAATIIDGLSLLGFAWVLRDIVLGRVTTVKSRS